MSDHGDRAEMVKELHCLVFTVTGSLGVSVIGSSAAGF